MTLNSTNEHVAYLYKSRILACNHNAYTLERWSAHSTSLFLSLSLSIHQVAITRQIVQSANLFLLRSRERLFAWNRYSLFEHNDDNDDGCPVI